MKTPFLCLDVLRPAVSQKIYEGLRPKPQPSTCSRCARDGRPLRAYAQRKMYWQQPVKSCPRLPSSELCICSRYREGQGGQLLSDEVVGQIFDLLFHSQQQVICGIKLAVVHSESLR